MKDLIDMSKKQLADSHAYSMTAFAQWLHRLNLTDVERDLVRAALAMAWLEGGKATIEEFGRTFVS